MSTSHRVIHFESIDSTNLEAARRAAAGERGPLWLWAARQTGGKGRLGRIWISEPGNLYATFLFSNGAPAEAASQLSFVAALAVHDIVQTLLPTKDVAIKWPNDVLIGGAKVCGILAETIGLSPLIVALGCGLNITRAPRNTPYPATALAEHGVSPPVESVLQDLDATLSNRLLSWDNGLGFGSIRHAWEQVAIGMGRAARARTGNETFTGIVHSLAPDGALVLELADKSRRLVHAGDICFADLESQRKATR